ncbi:MAG: hypothetical protein DHS20C16_32210 [Phycisphaerae bacterium]|nr:MAG: hypothetical protein DHS20C16_32210 [Phycisphaerae bacterium]
MEQLPTAGIALAVPVVFHFSILARARPKIHAETPLTYASGFDAFQTVSFALAYAP